MEKVKSMTLGKWCALYLVIAFIVQMVFLILKLTAVVAWSWRVTLIPLIITVGLIGITAILVGFAIMTINSVEKEKDRLED